MVAALVEATGHGYQELMQAPYDDVLQMNTDALAHAKAQEEAMNDKYDL